MSAHAAAGTTGAESIEVERKYEVDAAAALPAAHEFARMGLDADPSETFSLVATYFDTPDRALARAGIAVRQRTGGHDAGWHVKQRLSEGVREVAWPPAEEAPAELFAKVAELLGEETVSEERFALEPLAEMRTTRVVTLLRFDGKPVVEVADDRVLGLDHAAGTKRAWREWETELVGDASASWLEEIEPALLAAGAQPSLSFAKIARATGQLVAVARRRGADPEQIEALEQLDAADQEAARRLES